MLNGRGTVIWSDDVGRSRKKTETEYLILTQRSLLTFIWFSKMVEDRFSREQEDT